MPHRWTLSPRQAIAVQKKLAALVKETPLLAPPVLVAGADAAFSADGARCIAAVVVWHVAEQRVVEQVHAVRPVGMPYVPGLLSFREAPAVIAAIRKLSRRPDVFMFDAQGIAHPRRLGLAAHVGVVLDHPSIGCAKSRLCGVAGDVRKRAGFFAPLRDKQEVIGSVLRTRTNTKPLFISVGHRITLADARRVVMDCCTKYRLPEPTRRADRAVAQLKVVI